MTDRTFSRQLGLVEDPPSDNAISLIAAAVKSQNQYVSFVCLDLLWKFLWLIVVTVLSFLAATWLIGAIGSTTLEGPNLDTANPILLLVLANSLWRAFSPMVFGLVCSIAITSIILWLLLEASFRGGRSQFRVYFASGAARTAVLMAIAFLGVVLLAQDRSLSVAVLAAVILLGAWFLIGMIESVVRRDAVELIATDLDTLVLVSACLFGMQLLAGITLWGFVSWLVLLSSNATQFLAAISVGAAVLVLWTVLHSFLVAVRFSTIDIMRRNVVDD